MTDDLPTHDNPQIGTPLDEHQPPSSIVQSPRHPLRLTLPPWAASIRGKPRPLWLRSLQFWAAYLWRRVTGQPEKLSAEEAARRADLEQRRRLAKTLMREARDYEKLISSALANVGYATSTTKTLSEGEKVTKKKRIGFNQVAFNEDEIWFRVDSRPGKLPAGVFLEDLLEQRVLTQLSATCQHRVTARYEIERGLWFILERGEATRGVPRHVMYTDMLQRMPRTADSYSICIGRASNARYVYESVADFVHLLVSGAPGSGKSNFIHSAITTLVKRNQPHRLNLMLVDLKGGLELTPYHKLPHTRGLVTERDGVLDMLHDIQREGERRMTILGEAGVQNITQYNSHRTKNAMPRIVVVIDEWADVVLAKKRNEIEELMINILSRYRAIGIHVILATQVPQKQVISLRLKGNIPAKMAFSVPNNTASIVILDNNHAVGLQPRGRAIWQFSQEVEVQTPYMSLDLINAVSEGEQIEARAHDITEFEIVEFALRNLRGNLTLDKIWNAYKERGMSASELKRLIASMDRQIFTVGGGVYRVMPPAGPIPRRLVLEDEVENALN